MAPRGPSGAGRRRESDLEAENEELKAALGEAHVQLRVWKKGAEYRRFGFQRGVGPRFNYGDRAIPGQTNGERVRLCKNLDTHAVGVRGQRGSDSSVGWLAGVGCRSLVTEGSSE